MKLTGYKINILAVIMLVALRLTIGWHFFYEGVWKISNYEKFSTTPFMEMAKGPFAPLYYMMVYDIDGKERLKIVTAEDGKTERIPGTYWTDAWEDQYNKAVKEYQLDEKQAAEAKAIFEQYKVSLANYLAMNLDDIRGYFGSLQRFEEQKANGGNNAPYYKKRMWDQQQDLRKEVKGWTSEIDALGEEYRMALYNILTPEQQGKFAPLGEGVTLEGTFNFLMTAALTAIGLCMLLGFCNRLACLGGAVFLLNVVLTQPPWPQIYPPMPAVTGHSLIIDKNFVEMVAMIMLACVPVGRWAGLDYFIYRWIGHPLMKYVGAPMDPDDE